MTQKQHGHNLLAMNRYLPALGISLERGTSSVPDDGRFHVVKDGQILASYRVYAAADKKYRQVVAEAGGSLTPPKKQLTAEERRQLLRDEDTQKNLDLSDIYWSAAGKKHKGNKYSG